MLKHVITLTDAAVAQVKTLMAEAPEGAPVIGIRIGVKPGGCSGMSYAMEYATEQNPGEDVVEEKGIKIFIEPKATLFLIGTEMDYKEGDLESGFSFTNPNETNRCGCGKSFQV